MDTDAENTLPRCEILCPKGCIGREGRAPAVMSGETGATATASEGTSIVGPLGRSASWAPGARTDLRHTVQTLGGCTSCAQGKHTAHNSHLPDN